MSIVLKKASRIKYRQKDRKNNAKLYDLAYKAILVDILFSHLGFHIVSYVNLYSYI